MKTVLVAGLGSYNGDDQIGWMAVEALKKQYRNDPAITFLICDRTGLEWMTHAKNANHVVFVDAIRSIATAGTIHRVVIHNGELSADRHGLTSHGIDPLEALALAQILGYISSDVIFWGIELEQCVISGNLSTKVTAGMDQLVEKIHGEIDDLIAAAG